MALFTDTGFSPAFYQIIKDSRFPICRPYGTPNDDKNYDFGTSFWDGTHGYKANATNAKELADAGMNSRAKKLKTDFNDGEKITSKEWNQVITKIRQEFALRDEFRGTFKPNAAKIGYNEFGDSVEASGTDGKEFFNHNDEIVRGDYIKIYNDILTLFTYEVESEDTINNNRVPQARFSYDVNAQYKTNNGINTGNSTSNGKVLLNNLDEIESASAINEGQRQGNNWWAGPGGMREYMYRYTQGADEKVVQGNQILDAHAPDDVLTNANYGYTAIGTREIPASPKTIGTTDSEMTKTVTNNQRPHGNKDYIKFVPIDSNDLTKGYKPVVTQSGYYQVSDLYKAIRNKRTELLESKLTLPCSKTKLAGVDEYGAPIYDIETQSVSDLPIISALLFSTVPSGQYAGYTIDIKASNINKYFMETINLLSSLCVCNCNYCSCYGHEAACICYVVKVSGWCYSYMYENVNGKWYSAENPT